MLGREDRAIHEAAEYALAHLVAAQYPNGAWPQRFDRPPDPAKFPVKPASYPETWPREFPKAEYSARVDALRRHYPVLALPARDWVL